jgi:hypothetical protein
VAVVEQLDGTVQHQLDGFINARGALGEGFAGVGGRQGDGGASELRRVHRRRVVGVGIGFPIVTGYGLWYTHR